MTLELRTIVDDEIQAFYDAVLCGFHSKPVAGIGEWARSGVELDRTRAAFDDGQIVSTVRSHSSQVTLPGGVVQGALLTQVTTSPTHRRRGLVSRLLLQDFHDAVDRGDVVSYLVAAEYPIYGRFGYGVATERVQLVIDATTTQFLPVVTDDDAEVVIADPETWWTAASAVYDEIRATRPGFTGIPERWWKVDAGILPRPGDDPSGARLIVLRRAGRIVGCARYTVTDRWEHGRPRATCEVEGLLGLTALDEARLWRFCCELDWVSSVTADARPPGDPLRWFTVDARSIGERDRVDFTWVRVLSPAALAARRYRSAGALTIAVHDRQGLLPSTLRLEADDDGAVRCESTATPPDIELDSGDLGSLVMGGVSALQLAAAGRIVEHRSGTVDLAERLFRWPMTPWCFAGF